MSAQTPPDPHQALQQSAALLADFIRRHQSILVLTGAGCSTDSGIPAYRDHAGAWQNAQPIQHREFLHCEAVRRQYWARSLLGWPRIAKARPNATHKALSQLQQAGLLAALVTQNVDGLHRQAGSRALIELHGRADKVRCLRCRQRFPRQPIQDQIARENANHADSGGVIAPDGDALLPSLDLSDFQIPCCPNCQGVLKPDVVFFGDLIPRQRVTRAFTWLNQANALLVVGSSLMVFSGYRFCRRAHEQGKPIAALNLGTTRADPLLSLKLDAPCSPTLAATAQKLLG